MKALNIILFFILSLVSTVSYSQRFDHKTEIKEVFYEPNGEYAYILTGSESDKIYKWHIENANIESEWSLDFKRAKIYFVGEDVYVKASRGKAYSTQDKALLKLNKETNVFDNYYEWIGDEKDYQLLGIDKEGTLLLFKSEGLLRGNHDSWGPLYLKDVQKGTKTTIQTIIGGFVHWYTPIFQPVFKDKVVYVDFEKQDLGKRKMKLYDKNTGKTTIVRKKMPYGNFILTGFENLFVYELYHKESDKSVYNFYNEEGNEVAFFDWATYRGMMIDYTNKELYMLNFDQSAIDIFAIPSMQKVRTIPPFEDFYIREDRFLAPTITNGKKHRFIEEHIGDMRELIGYFEKLDFETGQYTRVGKMLRDGYSFEDYEELKQMTKEMSAQAMKDKAALNASQFKSDISTIQFLATSGNRESLEAFGKDMNGGKTWDVAKAASYDQLTTNMGKVCECESKLVVLLKAENSESTVEGDFVVYRSETFFYLSVVNSDLKYEAIKLVGKDVHVTKTNKHTIKVENAGFLSNPTTISWRDNGDTFSVNGRSGSFTVNKKICTIN